MLNLVNQLFKIYFKLNKLHLTKPLIRAVDSSPLRDKFSKAQLVTYRYYVGRKYMFDNSFKEAEEYLQYAFETCDRDVRENKRSILRHGTPDTVHLTPDTVHLTPDTVHLTPVT